MLPDILGSEEATDWNGPLSGYAEWHALALGLEAGLRNRVTDDLVEQDDASEERHYFAAGFVVGWALRQRFG